MVKNSHSQKSFTLIELLVITSIIIFLLAIILVNYRQSGEQFALLRSSQKLAQDIRRAGEMAMSAKEIEGPTGEKIIPDGGYGLFFQTIPNPPYYEIILFADCNDSQQYDLGNTCGTLPNKFSEKIENLNLEEGVLINSLSPPSPLTITFKPPNPTISISGGDMATITLSLESDSTKTKIIKVNTAGLVDIE